MSGRCSRKKWPLTRVLPSELEIVEGRLCHAGRWHMGRPFTTCSSSLLRAMAPCGAYARSLLNSELKNQPQMSNQPSMQWALGRALALFLLTFNKG